MVAGLEEISEGTISIDGEVVNDLQPKDRHISMVFQNYALYPHLTVFENIAFPLRLSKEKRLVQLNDDERAKVTDQLQEVKHKIETSNDKDLEKLTKLAEELTEKLEKGKYVNGFTSDEIYERVTNAADILGITEYLARKPRALSGGQRQRVAIGRAMVNDCKVFLMDEPLSYLVAKLRNQMRAEIILLRKSINTTFIYVTHDQTEAMTLGDRIVIMKDGIIMQVGTPSEVFDTPSNLFVAEFIGAPKMNTFKAQLTCEDDKYYVNAFGSKIEITGQKGEILASKYIGNREIILGVRPEHMVLRNQASQDAIECVVQVNEMMGSELHLHVLTNDGTKLIVRVPTVNLTYEEIRNLSNGNTVYVSFEGKVMHFFDVETEQSLLK